jgi:DNA-binding beta-propeller fold protein YncE
MIMRHALSYTLIACAVLLSACSTVAEKPPYDGPTVWPQPPDQPRFEFMQMLRSAQDIGEASEEAKLRESLTGQEAIPSKPLLDKPSAIAARNGRVYVADSGTNSIVVFDIVRRRIFRFGTREEARLGKPAGLAIDGAGNIYVADSILRKIMVFDGLGLFRGSIGDPKDLQRPTGVCLSPKLDKVYVVDRSFNEKDGHRVLYYSGSGERKVIGTRGSGPGEFNVPLQCAVAPDGTLYVLDSGNFRVQAFDADGKYLSSWGKIGKGFGEFARPRGIAVDKDGLIYVTDAAFNNFQVFNPKGELLMSIGQSGLESHPGVYAMINGIAVDENGYVYVGDQAYDKVEVFKHLNDEEGKDLVKEYEMKEAAKK